MIQLLQFSYTSVILSVIVVLILGQWIQFRRSHLYKSMAKLQTFPGFPIVGNINLVWVPHNKIMKHWKTMCGKYGNEGIIGSWIGHRAYVVGLSAMAAEAVLSSTTHIDKGIEYKFLYPWLREGLLTSTGTKWRHRRKLLTPAFHFRILDKFISIQNEQSEVLVRCLHKQLEHIGQKSFDIFPFIARCSLDIIGETAMGKLMNAQLEQDSEYVRAVDRITECIHNRQAHPWLWPDFLFDLTNYGKDQKKCLKVLHSFTENVIAERKKEWIAFKAKKGLIADDEPEITGSGKGRLAFLDLLLEASEDGKVLSDLDIREEVDTFMFEGYDTTTSGVSWTLYLLGRHPAVLEKVQEELDAIFESNNGHITSQDLKDSKYLECIVKESMRMFPPVPLIARQLNHDVKCGSHVMPAGSTFVLFNFFLHSNKENFPEPEKFNPDRFLPENSVGRHPYAYVPFSAGPRNCIGQKFAVMEEKIMLAHVLRSFSVEAVEDIQDLMLLPDLVLRSESGVQLKLTSRN